MDDTNGGHRRWYAYEIGVVTVVVALVLAVGTLWHYDFVTGIGGDLVRGRGKVDGFEIQLDYVRKALKEGGLHRVLLTDGLLVVHFIRYLVAQPFLWAQQILGSSGSLLLMCALAIPLLAQFHLSPNEGLVRRVFWIARSGVLLAPLVLSGRTVLVAIGAGYVVAGLYQRRRPLIWFAPGTVLLCFSSSAVLVCLLCVFATLPVRRWIGASWGARIAAVLLLIGLLVPSATTKFVGFSSGREGYVSTEEALKDDTSFANQFYEKPITGESLFTAIGIAGKLGPLEGAAKIVDRVLSRSTLYTSVIYRQYARLALYICMLLAVLLSVAIDVRRKSAHALLIPLVMLVLGLLLEGLGGWTVLWPLVWRYTGWNLPIGWQFPRQSAPQSHHRPLQQQIG